MTSLSVSNILVDLPKTNINHGSDSDRHIVHTAFNTENKRKCDATRWDPSRELQWHFGDSLNLFQSSREKSIVEENYYNLTSILQCNKFWNIFHTLTDIHLNIVMYWYDSFLFGIFWSIGRITGGRRSITEFLVESGGQKYLYIDTYYK